MPVEQVEPVSLTTPAVLLLAADSMPEPMPYPRWVTRVLVEQVAAAARPGPLLLALARLVHPSGAADAGRVDETVLGLARTGALVPVEGQSGLVWVVQPELRDALAVLERVLSKGDRRALTRGAQRTHARAVAWSNTAAAAADRRASTVTSADTRCHAVR